MSNSCISNMSKSWSFSLCAKNSRVFENFSGYSNCFQTTLKPSKVIFSHIIWYGFLQKHQNKFLFSNLVYNLLHYKENSFLISLLTCNQVSFVSDSLFASKIGIRICFPNRSNTRLGTICCNWELCKYKEVENSRLVTDYKHN